MANIKYPDFERILGEVMKLADQVVALDEQGDPESAHQKQDAAGHAALDWIAWNSSDSQSRKLASQALRAFDSDGDRWFA